MNDLVNLGIEIGVLVGKILGQVLLVDAIRESAASFYSGLWDAHFLGSLVGPEIQGTSSTFHDNVGTETTENAGLIVLGRVQIRNHGVIRI